MGQLAEGIVLPDCPSGTLLQRLNSAADVTMRIGEIVSAESAGAGRASQKGERVTVRLKGAKQKGQLIEAGIKTSAAFQKRGSQQFVAAFLQWNHLKK